jgi:hypothetical protein
MKRRSILKGLSLLPFGSGLIAVVAPLTGAKALRQQTFSRNWVCVLINAGTYTAMTGSLMDELLAIQNASKDFVCSMSYRIS